LIPRRFLILALAPLLLATAASAQRPEHPVDKLANHAESVYTRARVTSNFEEGGRFYVRLKLLPRSKIPFTTMTYRVRDRDLVRQFSPGATVEFLAERFDGENTVTRMRSAADCNKFQKC